MAIPPRFNDFPNSKYYSVVSMKDLPTSELEVMLLTNFSTAELV